MGSDQISLGIYLPSDWNAPHTTAAGLIDQSNESTRPLLCMYVFQMAKGILLLLTCGSQWTLFAEKSIIRQEASGLLGKTRSKKLSSTFAFCLPGNLHYEEKWTQMTFAQSPKVNSMT